VEVRRPKRTFLQPLCYVGGKVGLATWLLKFVPPPQAVPFYGEPFAGGAAVFWAKPRHRVELLNDLCGDLVNVYRCLQQPAKFRRLARLLAFTPYARAEYERAVSILARRSAESVRRAWATVVYSRMTAPSAMCGRRISFCASPVNLGVRFNRARAWSRAVECLESWHSRLQGVVIEQRDGIEFVRIHSSPEKFMLIDPPYLRSETDTDAGAAYGLRWTIDELEALIDALLDTASPALLCGEATDPRDARKPGMETHLPPEGV